MITVDMPMILASADMAEVRLASDNVSQMKLPDVDYLIKACAATQHGLSVGVSPSEIILNTTDFPNLTDDEQTEVVLSEEYNQIDFTTGIVKMPEHGELLQSINHDGMFSFSYKPASKDRTTVIEDVVILSAEYKDEVYRVIVKIKVVPELIPDHENLPHTTDNLCPETK